MTNYQKVLDKYTRYLLRKRGVVGVGFGYKQTDGEQTNTPSLVCSVVEKKSKRSIKRFDRIPKKIMGLRTDVVETGVIRALEFTDRVRPAIGGASIGHPAITAGTFGGVVLDDQGRRVILSNNHVMANSNNASIGDVILQPGPHDGGTDPADVIANLEDYVEINFGGGSGGGGGGLPDFLRQLLCAWFGIFCDDPPGDGPTDNQVDGAIALPTSDDIIIDEINQIGAYSGIAEAAVGMALKKFGRTTELTTGQVQQIGATVNVQYGGGQTAQFTNQILAGAMSAGGDSGSLVLNDNDNLVGLLFAGSDSITVMNRIQDVFEQMALSPLQ